MICTTEVEALSGKKQKFTVFTGASKKLTRKCRSSLGAEIQAASEAAEELEYTQLAWMEMQSASVQLKGDRRYEMIMQGPKSALVTDCKSLYYAVTGSESSALGLSDKRAAIECMAFKQGVQECGAELRWVHSHAQVADGCTKIKYEAQKLLDVFMSRGYWTLIHDPEFESARKRGLKGLDILAEKPPLVEDHQTEE